MLLHRQRRKEQKTWPRMAASEEWKIGRARMIAWLAEEILDNEKIAIAQNRCSGVTFALVRDEDPVEARLLGELGHRSE